MSKQIPLKNSTKMVTVDDADYEFLSQFDDWVAKKSDGSKTKYHAVRNETIGGKQLTIRMHRLITEADSDQIVYHLDDDTLNNTRRNLQSRTVHPWTGRPLNSGYRGVHQMSTNKWRSEIAFAGRTHTIGDNYDNAIDAAHAYDEAARRLYGNNAVVNFQTGG